MNIKKRATTEPIKKIEIVPGCIGCGMCETVCPDVFIIDGVAKVVDGATFDGNEESIREAVDMCPVQVIRIED